MGPYIPSIVIIVFVVIAWIVLYNRIDDRVIGDEELNYLHDIFQTIEEINNTLTEFTNEMQKENHNG